MFLFVTSFNSDDDGKVFDVISRLLAVYTVSLMSRRLGSNLQYVIAINTYIYIYTDICTSIQFCARKPMFDTWQINDKQSNIVYVYDCQNMTSLYHLVNGLNSLIYFVVDAKTKIDMMVYKLETVYLFIYLLWNVIANVLAI